MAAKLTKQDLIDYGVTGVFLDSTVPGGWRVEIHNKPIKAWKDSYGYKISVTDKTRPYKVYNGQIRAYRRALPLPRVVIAWTKGKIDDNWVAYETEKGEIVACSRSEFWALNVYKWARKHKGENEK